MALRKLFAALSMFCLLVAGCQLVVDDDGGNFGAASPFFLPTGEPDNTSAPSIEVDASGTTHAVYPAYADGKAYYARCGSDCSAIDDVAVVRFDTDGSVGNAMIALGPDGRPHVLLSTFGSVYYGSCNGDCSQPSGWTLTKIVAHGGLREVTGEALALDPEGRPRFLMHTYVAYLGVGQKPPETFYVTCDANCQDAASWTQHKLADQIWKYSQLRFDAKGGVRLGTVVTVAGEYGTSNQDMGAYIECNGGCTAGENWIGITFAPAYSNDLAAVTMKPAVALALTSAGAPRMALMSHTEDFTPNIVYLACDAGCTDDNWAGTVLSQDRKIGAGLDLTLDSRDRPRLAYTFDYNIGLAYCNETRCETPEASWELQKVETAAELPPDDISFWNNCYVDAWFLHSPSIALAPNGAPRVGYQARDIGGGWDNPDPNKPRCEAGDDMTWSRLAKLATP